MYSATKYCPQNFKYFQIKSEKRRNIFLPPLKAAGSRPYDLYIPRSHIFEIVNHTEKYSAAPKRTFSLLLTQLRSPSASSLSYFYTECRPWFLWFLCFCYWCFLLFLHDYLISIGLKNFIFVQIKLFFFKYLLLKSELNPLLVA